MNAPQEKGLRRLALKALYFLLRLYLAPLKMLLKTKAPSQGLRAKLKHSLKTRLTGNPVLLAHLLDPSLPDLHKTLLDNRFDILRRLLTANQSSLFKAFLNDPDAPAQDALYAHFHPGSAALLELLFEAESIRLKKALPPGSDAVSPLIIVPPVELSTSFSYHW